MNGSILLSILKNFSKQQFKDFTLFVRSPYFNTNKALVSLAEYIRKQHPDFSEAKLKKEYVYKKLFGKSVYNDGFFRVLMSNLQKLAEEFIAVSRFRSDTVIKRKYLIEGAADDPANRKFAERMLKEGLKEAESIEPAGPDDFLGKYYMAFYRKYLYSTSFSATKNSKPGDELFDEQKYLTYFYLLRMLADHFYHLNQSQIINYEPKLIFIEEIILFLERNPEYLEFPTLNMAYLRVLLLKNNRIEDLYRLKRAFYSSFEKLSNKDSFNIISIINNYCNKNYLNTEDPVYLDEKLDILMYGLNKGIHAFEEGDWFDIYRFHNIFSALLESGRVNDAEEFVNKYGEKIEPDERNFWVNFAMAEISLRTGKLEDALKYLSLIKNISSVTNKFALRALQLKVYYESGLLEQAFSAADSFRHFIQKDTVVTPYVVEQYRNFHSYFMKLLNVKQGSAAELKEKLGGQKNVMHKKWLMKKLEERDM